MDFDKDFTATKLKWKNVFSFSLTVFLVAGKVVLASTASITYGQVGGY